MKNNCTRFPFNYFQYHNYYSSKRNKLNNATVKANMFCQYKQLINHVNILNKHYLWHNCTPMCQTCHNNFVYHIFGPDTFFCRSEYKKIYFIYYLFAKYPVIIIMVILIEFIFMYSVLIYTFEHTDLAVNYMH